VDTDLTHVLIVDDVVDAADSMAELLSIWGYDARTCYSGATAIASALARRPCLVLLDVAMPRMDGYRFAEFFRKLPECGSVPIVAVSGYSGAAHYARAREVGIRHYLLKPADPIRLREMLAWHMVPQAPDFGGVVLTSDGFPQEARIVLASRRHAPASLSPTARDRPRGDSVAAIGSSRR
jgi:CheY-like chemotaxis protein